MLQCIRELSVFANTPLIFGVFAYTSNINGVLEYLIYCGSLIITVIVID